MKVNLMMFRISLYVAFIACSISSAQTFKSAGEGEFSRKTRKQGSLNLEFDLKLGNVSYSQTLLYIIDDELGEAGVALRGYYPISKEILFRFQLPYIFKLGMIPEKGLAGLLGGKDFITNWGLGDFHTTFLWNIIQKDGSRSNLSAQGDLIFPTGESRFSDSYDGHFPLGNGFTLLHFGIGGEKISRTNLFFGNTGYIIRFSRTFESRTFSGTLRKTTINPGNSSFVNAGIGFFIDKRKNSINFEFEHNWVGADTKGEYQVTRFGIRIVSVFSVFFGFENITLDDIGMGSVLEFKLPIRFKILGIKL